MEKDSKEIIELLLSKGADINIKNGMLQNKMLLFLININHNIKRKLNYKNKTPLHISIGHNEKNILELLLSKGADINAKDIIY